MDDIIEIFIEKDEDVELVRSSFKEIGRELRSSL